jgi:alanyl-tRNA synthetase
VSHTAVVVDIREESRDGGRQRWQVLLDQTEFVAGNVGVLEAVSRSGARLKVSVLGTVADGEDLWLQVEKPLAAGTEVWEHVDSTGTAID